jgi:sulfur-oxidizing protein SoxA
MMRAAAVVLAAALCGSAVAAEIPLADRKSGYEFMGHDTRAMQDDDTVNPATLSVLDGEALNPVRQKKPVSSS